MSLIDSLDNLADVKRDDSNWSLFLGTGAGNYNLGTHNFASGYYALRNITSSAVRGNTAIGRYALYDNESGGWNTAIGSESSSNLISGNENITIGRFSGRYLKSGNNNIMLGTSAGASDELGNDNEDSNNSIYIGSDTKTLADGQSNEIVIGHNNVGEGSNTVVLGNNSITQTYLKGKVNVDGAYVLPETTGQPGDVLKVPAAGGGNELVWSTPAAAYTLPVATNTSIGGIKVGNGLSVDLAGEISIDPNGITFPWTVEATGEAHRNSNIGIGDFSSNTPSYPLHISIPSASGTNYAAKIEGGSGIYVEEDVEVGGQIITSDIAPVTGTNMVTVGTDGILTSQAIPSLSSQWTKTGSNISNNNSGDIILSSSTKLGIGTNNPDFPIEIDKSNNGFGTFVNLKSRISGYNNGKALQGISENTGSYSFGIEAKSAGNASSGNYAGYFHVPNASQGYNIGVFSQLDNVTGGTNLAIYAEVNNPSGLPNTYAGFFTGADVKIENRLILNKVVGQIDNTFSFPTTRGTDGQVLSMSSTPGVLEWTSPSTADLLWQGSDINMDGNIDGIETSTNSYNVGIGTSPSSNERLKISGNTVIENGSNHVKLYLTPGSSSKSSEIWMGHSGFKELGLIKYQNNDNSMHFWANNTQILELTSQKVKIPATKTLENSGYLIVENTSTFKDNVTISGGDLTVSSSQATGTGGGVTFSGLSSVTAGGTNSYDMVVTDGSGGIHKMDMSDMGGHWSSDQSGNPYVENKNVGIGTNSPSYPFDINFSTNSNGSFNPAVKIDYNYNGTSTSAQINSGIYIDAENLGVKNTHGIYSYIKNSTSGNNSGSVALGGYGFNSSGNGSTIGVEGNVYGSSTGTNIGGRFSAQDGASSYGIYVQNNGSRSTDYAAYIIGKVEIDGNIKITGNSHLSGAVLTSDGNGNATWLQPAGSGSSGGSNSKTFNYLSDGF